MTRLAPSASGLRHLRWAREVLATLAAHAAHNPRLDPRERAVLRDEEAPLRDAIDGLSAAVKAYRDFLERTRVIVRGQARVAAFLIAGGADDAARAIEAAFEAERAAMEATAREPLRAALHEAKARLRAAMDQMDTRLGERVPAALVDSLYPPLTAGDALVADDGDPDDDATAAP